MRGQAQHGSSALSPHRATAEEGQAAGTAVWHRQGAGTEHSHTRLLSHHSTLWPPQRTHRVQQYTKLLRPPRGLCVGLRFREGAAGLCRAWDVIGVLHLSS